MQRYAKLFRVLFFPLYFLSFLTLRDKNLWLFGSDQNRFDGNARALFLYASHHGNTIRPLWITGDARLCRELRRQGYRACRRWSIPGLLYGLRAGRYFYNSYATDINFYTCGGATLVNLWHGIPLKEIEFDIGRGPLYRMFHTSWKYLYMVIKPYMFKRPDYVLSTSEETSRLFSSAFRIDPSRCLPFGYPRNDIFFPESRTWNRFHDPLTEQMKKEILEKKEDGQRILLYMPTWRSDRPDFIDEALPDFEKLDQKLKQHRLLMYIKPHPNSKKRKGTFSRIRFLDPLVDIYPLLPLSDLLLTDYSSIYFDYLLLDREILFYPFDLERYQNSDRGLYFDYDAVTPGAKAYTFAELLDLLGKSERTDRASDRRSIRERFFSHSDAKASERVFDFFIRH